VKYSAIFFDLAAGLFPHSKLTQLFCLLFGFFQSPTAKTLAQILTQNTSKDAVPRKDVPFEDHRIKV